MSEGGYDHAPSCPVRTQKRNSLSDDTVRVFLANGKEQLRQGSQGASPSPQHGRGSGRETAGIGRRQVLTSVRILQAGSPPPSTWLFNKINGGHFTRK